MVITEKTNTFCAYVRVSSKHQDFNAQETIIRRFAEFKGLTIGKVYSEKVSTKKTRPEYEAMLKALRRYEYAGVIVFRLDRLGRTASQLSLDIAELENKGLQVLSATEAYDTATAIGKAMRSIILIMAELERENNAEASVARRASAKLHGKHIGRHNSASQRQVRRVRQLRASGLGYSEIQKQTQLSYGTCFAIINFKGVYGPRLPERHFDDGQQFSKVDEDKLSDSATLETASVT